MDKALSLIAAPPGVGKTTFSFQLAIAVAFDLPFGPWGPVQGGGGKVWLINGEEPQDELDRRFLGACEEMGVRPHAAAQRVKYTSGMGGEAGTEGRFNLLHTDPKSGLTERTSAVDRLKRTLVRSGVRFLLVDPLVEFKNGDETNETLHALGAVFRSVAVNAECSVLAFHHTPKAANGETAAGDMNALRGGGSLAGVGRFVLTMFNMTKTEAARLGVSDERRASMLRIDNAKASMAALGVGAAWFQRVGVCLDNGTAERPSDWVGVMRSVKLTGEAPEGGEPGALPGPGDIELEKVANAAARLCVRMGWTGPDFAVAISSLVKELDLKALGVGQHKVIGLLKTTDEHVPTEHGRLVIAKQDRGGQMAVRVHFEVSG